MHFPVTNIVTWVGKTDWELRKFHGEEYSTHRGSTYNSYLVQDQKTALIDTVWAPFAKSYIEELFQKVSPEEIDFVIANHAEIDHSGALPELMRHLPGKPIYCTANGVKSLKGHYHADWNFQVVKTGDRLSLGDRELIFIEAPMLHWPDSMFCYLTGEDILFSNDAFGQHLAAEEAYNDRVDSCELWAECIKYYANILTPFSPLVLKKIEQFAGLELPLKMICPSHGVLWRDNPMQIVQKYLEWANQYREDQVTIIYDTMWNSTRSMAEAIAAGIHQASPATAVKVFNCARSDKNDVITEIFKSKAILFGSPTINQGILTATAGMLEEIRGLKFRGKKAAAFGAFGWSGESVGMLSEKLGEAGFDVVNGGLRLPWAPDAEALQQCVDFGRAFAETVGS
ncbi:rubredoxin:oxygen/nitric oxide oxidoreductase [Syntrophotalea carbinolica DSM 2380]|uniref:Rubredoxin:oxygen/nitric oxide oxidoreductase n=1 Tax=Syntrophotalea carbinolica (strain DSM 2380 / NBRC 103641 / GraBd1) TaxID=338963 RepID=Q3A0K1_SYNC1|nr:anaerobic nitric oxide reductase flavorubredoxin [Syntrophotalea carbinolica]ABA90106.1 rubredoxin:oxygen/nitric oxide oxidoreductase [Syntrophotalea carbinolica DSM 2380]